MRRLLYALTIAAFTACTLIAQARPGQFTTLVFTSITSLLNVTAFGAHTLSAGGTGPNKLTIANTTNGAGNYAELNTTAGNGATYLRGYATGYTPSGSQLAAGSELLATGAGGLSLTSTHASGKIRLYTNGGLRWGIDESGNLTGTSGRVVDAIATPTITTCTGRGTGFGIVGTDSAFRINIGTGTPGTPLITVAYNATFTNGTACVANQENTFIGVQTSASTTGVLVSAASSMAALPGAIITVLCRGF